MNGNFYKYVYSIHCDIELFEVIIDNFQSFKYEREYNGKTIYFYKLAQLLTYVELIFCNYFYDIDYKKYINNDYLPDGFDATKESAGKYYQHP